MRIHQEDSSGPSKQRHVHMPKVQPAQVVVLAPIKWVFPPSTASSYAWTHWTFRRASMFGISLSSTWFKQSSRWGLTRRENETGCVGIVSTVAYASSTIKFKRTARLASLPGVQYMAQTIPSLPLLLRSSDIVYSCCCIRLISSLDSVQSPPLPITERNSNRAGSQVSIWHVENKWDERTF